MGWYAYDANGYIGDVGTNTGWKALCDFLKENGNAEAKSLARDGWSDGVDFRGIPDPEDGSVKMSFDNLKELSSRCEEILIISDGQDLSEGEPAE